jgi:hypothetical protein
MSMARRCSPSAMSFASESIVTAMVSKRFEVSQRVWAFSFSRLSKRNCVEHVPGEGESLLQIQILPSAGVPREPCVDLERDQRQIAEDREISDRIERIKRKRKQALESDNK